MSLKVAKKPSIKWKKEYDQLFRKYRKAVEAANNNSNSLTKMRKDRDKYKHAYDQLLKDVSGYVNSIPE
ncbi:hypothetical protein [Vagococcus salmoninarum]|uniref:Uncharacterized protein n=1 Tax=Vagococcus salmoninarum TaxID=2739 RepID=A0A429ZSJ3_9ENTE|nr:hypothetical protein [Vagococcus salmoninarum]MBE9390150.1 hypothetical protein [Vagococcus salmoninarum]RST96641.1 hypothetical protein CBF35_05255 [Vagococcus salmoninarum]